MNIIIQLSEVFSNFQNETDDLKVQNEKLRLEISELRRLLIAGEILRSQYVLCCAMNVTPEIIMMYVKSNTDTDSDTDDNRNNEDYHGMR